MPSPSTVSIPLTKGQFAIVDQPDFERLSKFKWYSDGRYAKRDQWVPGSPGHYECIYMHRFIIGAKPGDIVDHADGDKLNNTRRNLRFCSARQNAENAAKKHNAFMSRFKGVTRTPQGKWSTSIRCEGRHLLVGVYANEVAAARAYDAAAVQFQGEFARLNLPGMPLWTWDEARSQRAGRVRSSTCQGVGYDKRSGKWRARKKIDGRWVECGYHATEEEAAQSIAAMTR